MPDPGMDPALQLQGELSRVNLLRIRGDISSAKTLCLATLKKFPTSVDAHVMMGDLHSEQADLAPAAEWYALALDLDPSAPGVSVKLNRIRAAMDISNAATQQKVLIDSGKKVSPWLVGSISAVAVAVAVLAAVVGSNSGKTQVANATKAQSFSGSTPERISAPRDFGGSTSAPAAAPVVNPAPGTGASSAANNTRPAEGMPSGSGSPAKAGEKPIVVAQDETLESALRERAKFAKNIVSVTDDPREKSMTITYTVAPDEHGRYTGAVLAVNALDYNLKATKVVLRGVRNGILSYMADVNREKVLEQAAERGALPLCPTHEWIDDVLENEYYRSQEITGQAPK